MMIIHTAKIILHIWFFIDMYLHIPRKRSLFTCKCAPICESLVSV